MRLLGDPLLVDFSISGCVSTGTVHTKGARNAMLQHIGADTGFSSAWLFRGLSTVRQAPACPGQRTERGSGHMSSTQWHPGCAHSSSPGKKFSAKRNPEKASEIDPSSLALHVLSVVTQDFSPPPSLAPYDVDRLLLLDWDLWTRSVDAAGSCWKVTSLSPPRLLNQSPQL